MGLVTNQLAKIKHTFTPVRLHSRVNNLYHSRLNYIENIRAIMLCSQAHEAKAVLKSHRTLAETEGTDSFTILLWTLIVASQARL